MSPLELEEVAMSTTPSVSRFVTDVSPYDREETRTARALAFVRDNPGAAIPDLAAFVYPELMTAEARRKVTTLIGSLVLRGAVRRSARGRFEIPPIKPARKLSKLRLVGRVRAAGVVDGRRIVSINFAHGSIAIEWPSGSGLPEVGDAWIVEARAKR